MARASTPRLSPELAAALHRGAQVVTATVRAARAHRRAFAEDQRSQGVAGWQAPAITDWATWLNTLHQAIPELPIFLSPLEEETLWKQVQQQDAQQVVSPQALAHLAQTAYALLSDYNAHARRRASRVAVYQDAHEDAARFHAWAAAFDALCAQLDVLPAAQLPSRLQPHVASLAPSLPREILLVGFDRLTPAQAGLLAALEAAGVALTHLSAPTLATQQQLFSAADEAEELRACALWTRARLNADPNTRIGILVPVLGSAKAAIDRAFRRMFTSQSEDDPAGPALPYEFSLGAPLSSIPLIAAALLVLRWLAGPLPAAEVTSLLTGGFLAGNAGEALLLAQLDIDLRRDGLLTAELSLAKLLRHAEAHPSFFSTSLTGRLRAAVAWQQRARAAGARPHTEWAEAAADQLAAWLWPGFHELDSTAYQARERWETLLRSVAALNIVSPLLRYTGFVNDLAGFAHTTLFAAESRNAPVQILGATEASGLTFDAIWFLQLTENQWPPRGRLHPLLPAAVQRDAAMPHTSGADDLALAEEQLRRILASAPEIVFSHARRTDGAEARISPRLRALDLVPLTLDTSLPSVRCEVIRDTDPAIGTPWPVEQPVASDALKQQSSCGFRSFAGRRLLSGEFEDEAWGLDPAERGILLHSALQHLWSTSPVAAESHQLHTRDDLRQAVGDGSIDDKLQHAIANAFLDRTRHAAGDPWLLRYLALEQQRLALRLRLWLDVEQDRAPFRVIALEQEINDAHIDTSTNELRLHLRVDRIDELSDGSRLLLDYKTAGDVSSKLWFGDRPDEPQLPIYARFSGIERVAGIAFAQIRFGGKTALHAIAQDPASQIGAAAKAALLDASVFSEWDSVLGRLAGEFLRGEAPVNPKRGNQTCQYCSLHGICRVRSQAVDLTTDDEEDTAHV
jgi:ATP-dependent helicase/nuclease subunit B